MTPALSLRLLALPVSGVMASFSWFCATLSLWSVSRSPFEQLLEGSWLLVVSAGSGAVAVANARIVVGRRGTSWWMLLGAAPAAVAAVAILVPWF